MPARPAGDDDDGASDRLAAAHERDPFKAEVRRRLPDGAPGKKPGGDAAVWKEGDGKRHLHVNR